MYNKTTWNSGDIITQDKWDNINNNLSIIGAYQLPVTEDSNNIIINKSYEEIISLLEQGIICYIIYNNEDICYVKAYNDIPKIITIQNYNRGNSWNFYAENNQMRYQMKV